MNKEKQKKLLTKIMEADARDGLYSDISKKETTQTDHIGDTNKMVTAVEWLVDSIWKSEPALHQKLLIEQAKQMEKEQIIKAFNDLNDDVTAEQYYNETYGKD